MRLLVTGDRNWRGAATIFYELELEANNFPWDDIVVVHGDARGADSIADVCAQLLGLNVERHPALWKENGRAAGPIRNRGMLATGIDYWLAFHEDIENSKGTADMVALLKKAGIPGRLIEKGA